MHGGDPLARLAPRVATVAAMAGVALIAFAGLGPVDHRRAVVSSIGGGALIAAIGLGVVVTYRSSGVVNFANAAMATYGAYTFTVLRRDGRLFLPPLPNPLALIEGLAHAFGARSVQLPNIPTAIDLGGPLNIGAAFAITLAVAALLGLAMHALVFRPLRHAPPLAKTVASVGLLLILQAAVVLRFSSQTVAVRPVFDKRPLHLLGTRVGRDQLVLGAIVGLVTAALWSVFRFSRFRLATRAASAD